VHNPPVRRRAKHFVALQQAVPGALGTLLRQTPMSDGKIEFAWRVAVGHAIDRATTISLDGAATLVVEVRDERWRQEIVRAERVILERLARLLGAGVVRRLRIDVDREPQRAFRW
jgi:hypothetical protein